MGYKHFGRIGDVWKHLPLCEVVLNESIKRYIETNSAYFEYLLEHSPEQNYGVGLFINEAERFTELKKTKYYHLIEPFYKSNKYLGSCGQIVHLLQNKPESYIFYDIDEEALESINNSVISMGLSHKVVTRLMDSATGVMELIPELNSEDFIHIDPYFIHQPNKDGFSYLDVFFEASKKGVKCFLWYGFVTLEQKRQIKDLLTARISQHENIDISCDELILNEIQENSMRINPGILGCGILTSNLTRKSIDKIEGYAELLVEMYKGARFKGMDGGVYHDKIN